jgi:hypothetical protein
MLIHKGYQVGVTPSWRWTQLGSLMDELAIRVIDVTVFGKSVDYWNDKPAGACLQGIVFDMIDSPSLQHFIKKLYGTRTRLSELLINEEYRNEALHYFLKRLVDIGIKINWQTNDGANFLDHVGMLGESAIIEMLNDKNFSGWKDAQFLFLWNYKKTQPDGEKVRYTREKDYGSLLDRQFNDRHWNVARYLIQHNLIDPTRKTENGHTTLEVVLDKASNEIWAQYYATAEKVLEVIRLLLENLKSRNALPAKVEVSFNAQDYFKNLVCLLKEFGVSISALDKEQQSKFDELAKMCSP